MKKIFVFLVLLLAAAVQAQTLEKGSISFIISSTGFKQGISVKAPFTSISLRKEDHYYLTARAEVNNDKKPMIINIEIELYKLWNGTSKDMKTLDSLMSQKQEIPFTMTNRINLLQFELKNDAYTFMILKDAGTSIGKYEDLTKRSLGIGDFTYATQKIVTKVSDTNIKMENNKYIIQGKFIIMLLNDNPAAGTSIISEIKDGVFEIII